MKLTIREKIIFIAVVIIFFAIGASILVNSIVITKEYSGALKLKAFVIAQTLKSQLDRLLKLKIPISNLVGFDEQCQDVVTEYEEISYAMVVDIDGTILFHNDPSKPGQVLTNSTILKDIRNPKETSREYSRDGEQFYNITVPVFGTHGDHIAAVILGFRTEYITQKSKKMLVYSVEVALSFIVLAIILLIIFLNVWVSRPLKKLMTVIHDIRQKGTDSTKLVEVDSGDEIGHLSSAFNQMMSELRDSHEKIKNYAQELEEKVRERTADLKAANEQMEKDIAERKRAQNELNQAYQELKRTQVQLIQSAKLASIGELAAGVAHELNQPLMYMRNSAQLQLQKESKHLDPQKVYKTLKRVEEGTGRMMKIINHLRDFARQTDFARKSVKLHDVLDNSLIFLNEQFKLRNIRLEKKFIPQLPSISGDPQQLEQVFLNLLNNAMDALEGREEPTLTIQTAFRSQEDDSGQVTVSFIDNGRGIAPQNLEKIFDPFFTTKEEGQGTGLGLSISYGIIRNHQGQIQVSSVEGEGSTFMITLPVMEESKTTIRSETL